MLLEEEVSGVAASLGEATYKAKSLMCVTHRHPFTLPKSLFMDFKEVFGNMHRNVKARQKDRERERGKEEGKKLVLGFLFHTP